MNINIRDTRIVGVSVAVALLVLGALPWVTVAHPFGSISASTYSTNGLIPLLIAAPVAGAASFRQRPVVGILLAVYAVANVVTFAATSADVSSGGEGMVSVQPGVGFILSVLLAVGAAVWLLVGLRARPEPVFVGTEHG